MYEVYCWVDSRYSHGRWRQHFAIKKTTVSLMFLGPRSMLGRSVHREAWCIVGAGVAMKIRVLGVGLVGSIVAACGDSSVTKVGSKR